MPHISAVLFDFGNVLSGPPDPAVWRNMQKVSGLDAPMLDRAYWIPRDDYDRGTLTGRDYWEAVAKVAEVKFSTEQRAKLLTLDVELWTNMSEPMLAWVNALHEAGIRTGILSNIGDAMAEGIRAKFDWIGRFHHAVWSHSLKLRKPEPEIYGAAAQALETPPQNILFIDDKLENIDAAISSGMQGIVYTGHAAFEAEMQERGYAYLLHPVSLGLIP